MQYVNLGRTGLKVSRLCLGCMSYGTPAERAWMLDEEASRPFIQRALEAGINFFDTADMYSSGLSEEILGRAIHDFARRAEVVLATKVYFPMGEKPNQQGLSRKHIMTAIDASLRRLGTEYVDLYQIHRWDNATTIEETLEALHDVVKAGKALYIGASSMYAWQFAKALYIAERQHWTRFVSMQNHYNLVYREEEHEMIPLCAAEGIAVIPWSPLARGFLAGNRTRERGGETTRSQSDAFAQRLYYADQDFDVLDCVIQLARERGVSPAQIALAWMLHKSYITAPIVGATKMHQLQEAIAALEIALSPEEMNRLEAAYQPHPVLEV
ncbi:MAG TPA: aldo/keto reductase [Anaerolineales bacterium]|nr:aldo/keto reductase [Anaerolineales bacterium]